MPKAAPAKPDVESALPATYEEAMDELESLAGRIESGDMPLDDLLGAYQRGAQLLAFCRGKLERVDEQIKVLEAGTLKPWMPE